MIPLYSAGSPGERHGKGQQHGGHRLMAYALVAFVIVFVGTALRSRLIQPEVRLVAVGVGLLTLFQVVLGIVTLMHGAPMQLSMLHQAVAAMLLAFAVALTWRARRI